MVRRVMRYGCVAAAVAVAVMAGGMAEGKGNKPDETPAAKPAVAEFPIKSAKAETLSDEQVVRAMQKAIDFLLDEARKHGGTWEYDIYKNQWHSWEAGNTVFATYALLHAGASLPGDARLKVKSDELKPAVEFVKKTDLPLNYIRDYQTAIMAQLGNSPENKALLTKFSDPLVMGFPQTGGYSYKITDGPNVAKGSFDLSNSQLGLLAAWERVNAGVEVGTAYWQAQERFWRKTQTKEGCWQYKYEGGNFRKSEWAMTTAALASLCILQEQLDQSTGLTMRQDPTMDAGFAWLEKNFKRDTFFSNGECGYYFLYTFERAGLAMGRKTVSKVDWYRIGAAELLRRQDADGSWGSADTWFDGGNRVIPTSMALIFLARGRNPVAFNKLQYPGNTWHARGRDVANLTARMSRDFERPLNWQIVDSGGSAEEWMDAPVLLITGSGELKLTDEEIGKLRTFVEAGGMIFSTTDGGGAPFTKSVQDAMVRLCDKRYEPRELPREHAIFSVWQKPKESVRLVGLSNGAREWWVHSPTDMGAAWQRRQYVQGDTFTVPADLYLYAAGGSEAMQPRLKGLGLVEGAGETKNKVAVARVQYAGNWDPEPGAWRRFVKVMKRNAGVEVTVNVVKAGELNAKTTPVAVMTGTAAFTLTDADVAAVRKYLKDGGTLLVDSAGGREGFDEALRKMVAAVWTEGTLEPVPSDDALFTGKVEGTVEMKEAAYRKESKARGGGTAPRLSGIKDGGRWVVLYSPEDVTSGLLGTNTLGIYGYKADSAETLMRNMLVVAATKK